MKPKSTHELIDQVICDIQVMRRRIVEINQVIEATQRTISESQDLIGIDFVEAYGILSGRAGENNSAGNA